MFKKIPSFPNYSVTNSGEVVRNNTMKRVTPYMCRYARCDLMIDGKRKTVAIHRLVYEAWSGGIPKDMQIDHIDGEKHNNPISNLRLCSPNQNQANSGKRRGNKSGYKGVMKNNEVKKDSWIAVIKNNYKQLYLGTFNTKEAAARAYDKKAIELWGEFAKTNF